MKTYQAAVPRMMRHGKPVLFVRTGEFREPRKGEWYLSGAIPEAYKAPNDLSTKYHILREAEVIIR